MARKKRRSNNPAGRPVTVGGATYLLTLTPELLQAARESARLQDITLAEWWRNAAWRELGAAISRPDPAFVE